MSKIKNAVLSFIDKRPVISTIAIALAVFACLAVLFWFVVFSGLSSSADFIYSHF